MEQKISFAEAKKLYDNGLKDVLVSNESLYGKFLHRDILIDQETIPIGTELNEELIVKITENNINKVFYIKH